MNRILAALARYGPKRFYALNTGVSTIRPLRMSAELLAKERNQYAFHGCSQTHGAELETSMMLVITPSSVDRKRSTNCAPAARPNC